MSKDNVNWALFWGDIKTYFQIIILSYCSSKMKRILKKRYQLKLLNLGFNKINFPQSNPTLDNWEQKKPNQTHSKSRNTTSPLELSNLFPLKGLQANRRYFCAWTTASEVSYKLALNKNGLENFIFTAHTEKNQTNKVIFYFNLTESHLLYIAVSF